MRALAVAAVFAFHAGVLPGGFIGVDVFFAISGYLITGLALTEIEANGRLDLWAFWARRARRLLPALFALVAAVLVVGATTDAAGRNLGRDVIAALAYVANWTRVAGGDAYFDAYATPSLLQHTWSLAVEEQFYIVWPMVLVGLVALARRRHWRLRPVVGVTAGVFAVTSTAWATWLAASGEPPFDRLYFGTDTRAVGLATGCAVACATVRGATTGDRAPRRPVTVGAVLATAVLAVLCIVLDGTERWLYGPGFALIALASVVLVEAASRTGTVARLLSVRPLPGIGRVSYGVYLWHWPVIVLLDRERTGLDGPVLGALWIAVTAAATAVSWVLVERPAPLPVADRRQVAVAYTVVPLALALVALTALGDGRPAIDPDLLAEPSPTSSTSPTSTTADTDAGVTDAAGTTTSVATTTTVTTLPAGPVRVLVLGDSVAESLGTGPPSPIEIDGRPVDAVASGIVACPIHPAGRWRYDDGSPVDDPPECEGDDRFDAVVDAATPDVIVAMFGWPGTIAGRELDDGSIVAACEPEHDTAWADGFVRLADRYGDRATVVALTVAPPQRFVDPDQSERPDCLNDALRATGIPVVEWGDWLCPDGDCGRAAALRRDAVHFAGDPEVQDVVWRALLGQVLDGAVP